MRRCHKPSHLMQKCARINGGLYKRLSCAKSKPIQLVATDRLQAQETRTTGCWCRIRNWEHAATQNTAPVILASQTSTCIQQCSSLLLTGDINCNRLCHDREIFQKIFPF